jgi:23S rRNA (cytosine1962-C5)-methyltransferase
MMKCWDHYAVVVILCFLFIENVDSFMFVQKSAQIRSKGASWKAESSEDTPDQRTKPPRNQKREPYTIGDLRRELLSNPAQFQAATTATKSKSRRTRKRVESPKQQYLYASQRLQLQQKPSNPKSEAMTEERSDDSTAIPSNSTASANPDLAFARELGLIPSAQHCDPCPHEQPKIMGSIRVHNEDDESPVRAYILEKPAGWAILGSSVKKAISSAAKRSDVPSVGKKPLPTKKKTTGTPMEEQDRERYTKRVSVKNDDGSFGGHMEYNELDVLALLSPEELEEYQADVVLETRSASRSTSDESDEEDDPSEDDADAMLIHAGSVDEDACRDAADSDTPNEDVVLSEQTLANLQRIAARTSDTSAQASFAVVARPSVVSWLKEHLAAAGTPIRGGSYWTALAGAVEVDDTGLVLLCPKSCMQNVGIEVIEYVAAVGSGGSLNPSLSNKNKSKLSISQETVRMEVLTKLRRVQTVKVLIPDRLSSCSNVVNLCQEQFKDGIRGDAVANPLDRRAPRRLIHCRGMSISSLTQEDTIAAETECLPDDIAVLAERRNHLEYKQGSFLGRSSLKQNPLTTAYREVNGAADGFPGWTVDRYGDWLSVYHDTKYPKGPLPSIHDGNTLGVYYLESNPDRSSMGTEGEIRPRLLEGRPAPDLFPIVENGVTFLVSLNRDLSTGIFLDQRLHRGWLRRNCGPNTRVLNCFAHTGAFSVAAASAGASTVSLDLSKKWLNRLPEQLMANGIAFDDRHDCIYGDCFDWLTRLSKRNELYDIVILDPPSTSIGQKRKRWSIQDMDELVALAVGLVKKGGVLWTTTNSASMPATKFARLCRKGFVDAGVSNAKLERVQPMPADFPCVGSQQVKNLVWRIQ